MTTPVRRKTDPVPGTRARSTPVTNDAFTQKMPKGTAAPKEPAPVEGYLARQRRQTIDDQVKKAEGYKRGGPVKKRKC
jgi:hypothetical protein